MGPRTKNIILIGGEGLDLRLDIEVRVREGLVMISVQLIYLRPLLRQYSKKTENIMVSNKDT